MGQGGPGSSLAASGRDWTWGRRMVVQCGQISYLLWTPASLTYNGLGGWTEEFGAETSGFCC